MDRKTFTGTKFFLCPVEAKHANGLVKSNNKLIKRLLRSQLGLIKKKTLGVFESLISLQMLFKHLFVFCIAV